MRFFLAALANWSNFYNGGNQYAGWASYLSFFRHVAKLEIDWTTWDPYELLAIHSGPRFLHADFWIVSDFPTAIRRDGEHRPHCADGPALAWGDGWALYYWHGVRVPRIWIEAPTAIDAKLALTHPNIEQRRCLAEILGWKRVLALLAPRTVDVDPDPEIGTLLEVEINGARERFLQVRCGTGRDFVLAVPPDTKTALDGNAWTFGLDGAALRLLEVRT